ncbi:FAD/NAD-P-binding domain-containing protein [Russula emetica]|nr:FAD/NAD-P-binding domain-containing protein [Russula emetica]
MALKPSKDFSIAIVGAGFGGLAVAIGLKTKWRLSNFVIFERGADIGGTWRDNTYPGCGSDVPVHFYSFSTDPKPDWDRNFATQPEILEYMHGVVDKYGLRTHCQFHTSVDKAEWDADKNMWRIETRDVRTGKKQLSHATVLVSAIGILVVPRIPKLQGIESFKGEVFHSARWRHDVDLRGKRVGVLGNGSSATQFIPIISEDPTVTVVNFARTAMWYVSPSKHSYSAFAKWTFANIPLVRFLYRFIIAITFEISFFVMRAKGNNYLGLLYSKSSQRFMKATVPAKYHHLVIPTYPFGCKRIVRDQGYLQSLNRPNVRLTFDHIARVEPDGVVTTIGEKVPLDVIIYATGFITDNYPLDVRGTRNTLKEYNDAHGGPMAYLGSTVPGFPNFFMMQGPNTTTGHTSVIFSEESQVPYLLQLLEPLRAGLLKSVAPTDLATDRYNDMLQERLQDTVWSQCASWYRVGGRGRIASTFPGPLVLFWWWLRRICWEDYEIKGPGAEEWRRRRHTQCSYKSLLVTVALVGLIVALVFAVLLGVVEPREFLEEAVTFFLSYVEVVRAESRHARLMQRNAAKTLWNRLLERFPM